MSRRVILSAFLELNDETDQYKLTLYVDPKWREFVKETDRDYIEDLLKDFPERARQDPEALFKHLCSLGVGPLVTLYTGTISDASQHQQLTQHFIQL
jgi:hypothetical protein